MATVPSPEPISGENFLFGHAPFRVRPHLSGRTMMATVVGPVHCPEHTDWQLESEFNPIPKGRKRIDVFTANMRHRI